MQPAIKQSEYKTLNISALTVKNVPVASLSTCTALCVPRSIFSQKPLIISAALSESSVLYKSARIRQQHQQGKTQQAHAEHPV